MRRGPALCLRFEEGPGKLLQGQAVVAEEARHGHRRGGQDAQPAGVFLANGRAQQQIDGNGDPHGNHGTEELPGGQAEKNAFLVLAYLFRNFDFDVFDNISPRSK